MPKSDKHSIETKANPAIIAGLIRGQPSQKFHETKVLIFSTLNIFLIDNKMMLSSTHKHMEIKKMIWII